MSEYGNAVVVCDNVACTYGRGDAAVVAVHGLSCELRRGDRIALSGPSGSGKSTVLHLLGLDHEKLTYNFAGRPFRLTDVHGKVASEIMA